MTSKRESIAQALYRLCEKPSEEKQEQKEALDAATKAFLDNGGQITELDEFGNQVGRYGKTGKTSSEKKLRPPRKFKRLRGKSNG